MDWERIQTGVRLEKRMVKVLKGLAEYMDLSLGELLEVIVLQGLEGGPGFSKGTLRRIDDLKKIYGMDYDLREANRMIFSGKRPS